MMQKPGIRTSAKALFKDFFYALPTLILCWLAGFALVYIGIGLLNK